MTKRLLNLFSGTGYVGVVAKELGYEVISLDRDMEASIEIDIMDWDPRVYPPNYFDVIYASPPCTEYSRAKTTGIRDIEGANEIVQRALDILEYFEPTYWIIENPQTGLLKDQSFMWGIPFKDVDYCRYGLPYRKRTRIWNNVFSWEPKPLCNRDCNSMNDTKTKHTQKAQRRLTQQRFKQSDLCRVPSELIREIFLAMTF